ncbi:MAG: ATP-binding protein [Bdellovibrionota bacterium]
MKRTKIAVTGGPSGGKTTLLETLKKELGQEASIVPEAASLLYRGGFPRGKTPSARIHTQKAIYYTQKEIENLIIEDFSAPLIVCDRGSLDSIAYWPYSEEDFFKQIDSTRESELNRYDWVLHLDTASSDYYDSSNPIRTESHAEAVLLNERIRKAWTGHPQRLIISEDTDFLTKMAKSIGVITAILDNEKYEKIVSRFGIKAV